MKITMDGGEELYHLAHTSIRSEPCYVNGEYKYTVVTVFGLIIEQPEQNENPEKSWRDRPALL